MKYIVYLTINLSDNTEGINRIYVGVHKVENPKVFDGYIGDGVFINLPNTFKYPRTPFQYAVKKYGSKSFRREVLYIYNTAKEAYLKEKEIVDTTFLEQDHVYNVFLGGDSANMMPLYLYNLEGKLIKQWKNATEACDFYGYPLERFKYAINTKKQFLNYLWSWDNNSIFNSIIQGSSIVLYVFSTNGKCIKEFYDYKTCEEFVGTQDLHTAIKELSLVNDKYYISNKLTDKFIPKPRRNYLHKVFYVYGKNNTFYGKFVGKELMKAINLHSWRKIKNIFEINNNWYKEFYITFNPVDKVPERISKSFKIDVYDRYGTFIETINSPIEVKEKYKISSSQLKNIQLGDKYFKNWIFKYHSK